MNDMKPEKPTLDVKSLKTKSFGGLHPKAVAEKFAAFEAAWTGFEERYDAMVARVTDLEAALAEHEAERATIQAALVSAQKAGDDMRREAERMSEMLEDQARKRSDEILSFAKTEAERVEGEHRSALKDLQNDLERHMLLKHRFVDDFRMLLRGYLAELDAKYPSGSRAKPLAMAIEEAETAPEDAQVRDVIEEPSSIDPSGD